jgi:hypothetical protein
MLRFAMHGAAVALTTAILLAGAAAPVQSQGVHDFMSGPRFGIGYNGVIPDVLAGAGAWYIFGPRRIGVFVDGKTTVPNPESHANYCPPRLPQCTLEYAQSNYNHDFLRDHDHWLLLNAGGIYVLSREFAIMLGGGLARLNRTREFVDLEESEEFRMTWEGNYLVPHPDRDQWTPQATIAGLVRAGNRVAFSFGYETGAAGMSVGLYVMLP